MIRLLATEAHEKIWLVRTEDGRIMEVRMEDKQAAALTGIDPIVAAIQQRLQTRPKDWLQKLQQNPSKFGDLEQEIHRAFAQMADQVVAGLLAESTAGSDFADAAKKK
jgi:hypothetical protein